MLNKSIKILSAILLTYSTASIAIECPTSINCENAAGDPKQCTLVVKDTDKKYWPDSSDWQIGSPIASGTYFLTDVSSPYETNYFSRCSTECTFIYSSPVELHTKSIMIFPLVGGYMEADSNNKPNAWSIEDHSATCSPTASSPSCPLVEAQALTIAPVDLYSTNPDYSNPILQITIDGAAVKLSSSSANTFYTAAVITPAIAASYCKNKELNSKCTLSISLHATKSGTAETNYAQIPIDFSLGTVTFNRTTVKIMEVTPSKETAFITMKQYTPFNSLGFDVVKEIKTDSSTVASTSTIQ